MKKTEKLKELITRPELDFLCEAHNGLSAKIVEEAGFPGIWASSLALSASLGIRDNNEASWTQVLEMVEFINDAIAIPVLLDGDTGYGDFNTMRRLVRKLEQRGIAGVSIEDKLYPKTNSFINSEAQPLARIDEFCGKIKSAKDTQSDSNFCLIARVEAFIAGWGLQEALERAEAYRQAGADAVLVHSKRNDCAEIEAFMNEWGNRHPVVIVPTRYYSTPTEKFRRLGISMVIWANPLIRAVSKVMQEVTRELVREQSLASIEDKIAPVTEIFRLQGAKELEEAEVKYLPGSKKKLNAVILAASQGENFQELTREIPKALLKIHGKTLLAAQIENFNQLGIKDVTVVRGFAKERIQEFNIKTIDNNEYEKTSELYSLSLARDEIKGETVISYGDIVYKRYVLSELLNDAGDITLVADTDWERMEGSNHSYRDFVETAPLRSKKFLMETVPLRKMSPALEPGQIRGEFIGLWKVSERGSEAVRKTLEKLSKHNNWKRLRMADLFNALTEEHSVSVCFIRGSWLDIDEVADLHKASEL